MEFVRSLLFVPGHQERMLEKASDLPADGVILDLEDAVPELEKENARAAVGRWMERSERDGMRLLRLVRASSIVPEQIALDLDAVLRPGLGGFVLPKVETAEEVQALEPLLREQEERWGLEPGSVGFVAAIETARGLVNAPAIAASSPRIIGMMFGGEDFSNDLGLPARREGEASEMLYARSALAVAAASVHVPAVDTIWADFRDPDGLRDDAELARRLGFSVKPAIHPAQIDIINVVFSPDVGEIQHARRIMAAVEEAGTGAIRLDGQMIDAPIVNRARRTLALAEANERRAEHESYDEGI